MRKDLAPLGKNLAKEISTPRTGQYCKDSPWIKQAVVGKFWGILICDYTFRSVCLWPLLRYYFVNQTVHCTGDIQCYLHSPIITTPLIPESKKFRDILILRLYIYHDPPLQVFTNTKKRTTCVNTFRTFGSSVSTIAFRPCKTKCRHNESRYFEQPISYFEIMNRFFYAYTSYAH